MGIVCIFRRSNDILLKATLEATKKEQKGDKYLNIFKRKKNRHKRHTDYLYTWEGLSKNIKFRTQLFTKPMRRQKKLQKSGFIQTLLFLSWGVWQYIR